MAFAVTWIKPFAFASQPLLFYLMCLIFLTLFSLPPSLSERVLSSTQPLHSAASGIVGKLHRLLKIEQASTLQAIFLLGGGIGLA